MEQINSRVLNEVDPEKQWCKYLSSIPSNEVNDYLSAADAFISLSTFRGEDFGMSVAEAKSNGLPTFLTDWGGYGGYSNLPETYFAKVSLTERDLLIDLQELHQKLEKFERISNEERKAMNKTTASQFGIDSIKFRLKNILQQAPSIFQGMDAKWVVRRKLVDSSGFGIMSELKDLYDEYSR